MSAAQEPAAQPFDDIRVVEFGQFVAVPFAAQLLAEGGARVIKVEAPQGDPTRALLPLAPNETRTFISRNRGKRSLPLALRDAAAKPVLDALLAWADVALLNFRPGLAEALGLAPEALTQRFPRLIVGSVSAFGLKGPEAAHAGMDIVVQARSGLMAANGREVDGRPAPGDPVSADYMCAMSLAFGVSAALLRRERSGRGGVVDTSLLQAALTLANNQLVRVEAHDGESHRSALRALAEKRAAGASFGEQRAALPTVRAPAILNVYFRTYETADSHVAIACGSPSLRLKFIQAIGLRDAALEGAAADVAEGHYAALQASAEAMLKSRSTSHWLAALNEAGVPVASVKFPIELFDDAQTQANGMFHTIRHPAVGDIMALSPPVRLDGGGFSPRPPTAAFGSETQAILGELGFSEAAIDGLVEAGVTHRGQPG